MDVSVPQINAMWFTAIGGLPNYTGSGWFEVWRDRVITSVITGFRKSDIVHVPSEYIGLKLGVDSQSIEHLWIKSVGSDGFVMDLGQVRSLLDMLLVERSSMRVSSSEYSEWLMELLKLLNADEETGSVRKEKFQKLFGLWWSSRLWFIPRKRSMIEEILLAWDYVDVSGSGVVRKESLSRTLLPFAFRVICPETGRDDAALKSVWVERMLAVCVSSCKKTDWLNHWMEFSNLDPSSFRDLFADRGTRVHMATQALRHFKIPYNNLTLVDFESLFELADHEQSRLFCLWLVTLNHGNKEYALPSLPETLIEPNAIIRNLSSFRALCRDIWASYVAPSNAIDEGKILFNDWVDKMILCVSLPCAEGTVLVLRDTFVGRFFREEEVEALWPAQTSKISAENCMRLLTGLYKSLEPSNGNCAGPWIIELWMHQLVLLAMHATGSKRPEISKSGFKAVFPLFYASLRLESQSGDTHAKVWPESEAGKLVFSKPHLRNMLRDVWQNTVPGNLNLVCQDWWVSRCCAIFEKAGRGVSRADFLAIFITPAEIEVIIKSLTTLDAQTLSLLLVNACVGKAAAVPPTDWISEYFMIGDIQQDNPLPTDLEDQFRFAFPLWLAAHSCIDLKSCEKESVHIR